MGCHKVEELLVDFILSSELTVSTSSQESAANTIYVYLLWPTVTDHLLANTTPHWCTNFSCGFFSAHIDRSNRCDASTIALIFDLGNGHDDYVHYCSYNVDLPINKMEQDCDLAENQHAIWKQGWNNLSAVSTCRGTSENSWPILCHFQQTFNMETPGQTSKLLFLNLDWTVWPEISLIAPKH